MWYAQNLLSRLALVIALMLQCAILSPGVGVAATLGKTTVGNQTDTYNSNWINASRFVTGASAGTVTSMTVNVGNVAAAPNNAFQVAIYSDSSNSPATLIAQSTSNTLVSNSWRTVAISATLAPNTAYWLAYNTNGTSPSVNNLRYSSGGTSAWTNSGVAFNTWPANFGPSTKASVTFSIYATYTTGTPVPPTVSLTAPANGSSVFGTQAVTATAANAVGVQFKLDGANLGAEDTTSPYSVTWDTTTVVNGSHSLSATARSSTGVTATSSISVNVNNVVSPPYVPDQPILLITDPANAFTSYYTEILDSEGIKSYNVRELNQVDSALLDQYDMVVLGEMALGNPQVTMLTNWVNAGGKLIAMKPDKKLASLLGLADAYTTLSNAYLKVDTESAPGLGIVDETIQYHGTADRYNLNGAGLVATLYSNATTATLNPAVSIRSVGSSGGQAAAFSYDLARSVVQTRQGNVAWAGQQRDGIDGYTASEMFFGVSGEPDWNNLDKALIPIADEQQRLFANLILTMEQSNNPLPRLWYLPRRLKAAVLMTGDDEGAGGTANRFDIYLNQSPAGCNVADWECVRASSYIWNYTPISNSQVVSFTNQGFEIGLHVNTFCQPWGSPSMLAEMYSSGLAELLGIFPGLPSPSSSRTHCVEWDDWATQPKTKLANGIRLDTDYYYFPDSFVKGRPGYFNGTGMPMRFADVDGSIIDVYLATTQITDESGLDIENSINTMLDNAIGPEGYYAVITANMHTAYATSPGSDTIVAAAQARGIPVVSGRQMLQWLDARNASGLGAISWGNATLGFDVTGGANGLTGMVPMDSQAGRLATISRGSSSVNFTTATIKGIAYALFTATPGAYTASYTPDTTSPTIVSTTPEQGAINVSTATTVTFSASEPLDPATVTNSNAELRDHSGALVPAEVSYNSSNNSVVLTPSSSLLASTAYTATAKTGLRDLAGNALTVDNQVSFTTGMQPVGTLIGNNQVSNLNDTYNSNWINGSRFVNGASQNNITSMSVYVRGVDSAPNNKFQMAIYTDSNGSPGLLVASTAQGILTANAWNTLAIAASLSPNTAYWLTYNTNGSNPDVNNMAYGVGSNGQGAYTGSSVSFGTWPSSFGPRVLSTAVYSIYAQ